MRPEQYHPLSPTRLGLNAIQIARACSRTITFIGEICLAFLHLIRHPKDFPFRRILIQFNYLGAQSLLLVLVFSFMIGAATAAVVGTQLSLLNPNQYIPALVALVVVRLEGSYVFSLIVVYRMGLYILSQTPRFRIEYTMQDLIRLVISRIFTMLLIMPMLFIYSCASGIFGGYLVGAFEFNVATPRYIAETQKAISMADFHVGLGKAMFFGIILALISGYYHLVYYQAKPHSSKYIMSMVVLCVLFLITSNTLLEVMHAATR